MALVAFGLVALNACNENSPILAEQIPGDQFPSITVFAPDNPNIQTIVSAISIDSLKSYVETLVAFYTRHSISGTISDERGIGAARRWIFRTFESISQRTGGRLRVEFEDFTPTICGETRLQRNVVAKLPGSANPERQILVSGHYDSRNDDNCDGSGFAPGSNDDGSGTAGILELARVLSQYEFEATLIFVAFTSEEQGLFGSRYYAQQAKARGDNIIAMVTNDVIGNVLGGSGMVDSMSVRCFSQEPMESQHRQLARYIKLQGEAYLSGFIVNVIPSRDRPNRGGDHFAFDEQGYTAARLTEPEDNMNHQHNTNDLLEFMSFSYLRKVVQVNAAYLANLGWAPPIPTAVRLEKIASSGYKISWQPGSSTEMLNYFVALRNPTAVTFDSLLDVGAKTEIVLANLPASVFISVSAVDEEKNESLFSREVKVE